MVKRALIIGVSGQDGAYLAKHLISQSYEVIGVSRDAETNKFSSLVALGIFDKIKLDSISVVDFRSVAQIFQNYRPDEVYNLSGQSSVGLSFSQPVETIDSHLQATITILEVIKFLDRPVRFYNACSSECFGETLADNPANEITPFRPRSPYALGKAAAHWAVVNYREAYGLYACSGILGNHESPLRPVRFVTQKIVSAAHRIAAGVESTLVLGDMRVIRDWGWAEEYVEAMNLMLIQDKPSDYLIATGHSCSLWGFAKLVFSTLGLDAEKYIKVDESLFRPTDIRASYLDPSKASRELGWASEKSIKDIVEKLLAAHKE